MVKSLEQNTQQSITTNITTVNGPSMVFSAKAIFKARLHYVCSTARMKLAPVPILSVFGLPVYIVQARIERVRVGISDV